MSASEAVNKDNATAYTAVDAAIDGMRQARPGLNKATAMVLLANALAIRMAGHCQRAASDFYRATGDAFAPLTHGKELAEARRLRAAQAFIAAAV